MARTVYTDTILRAASELITEPELPAADQNPEYDRAILELTAQILGLDENHDALKIILHAL